MSNRDIIEVPKLGEVESLEWGVVYECPNLGLVVCIKDNPDSDDEYRFVDKDGDTRYIKRVDCIKPKEPEYVQPSVGSIIRVTHTYIHHEGTDWVKTELRPALVVRVNFIPTDTIHPACTCTNLVTGYTKYLVMPVYTAVE